MPTGKMTLTTAEDFFRTDPTKGSAADLLTVALGYWLDEMIGDDTFEDKVRLVRDWLRKELD